MKPQLANDADLASMPYPMWFMPKIDGVRGMNPEGTFVGRSLDPFLGYGVTELFSGPPYVGLDGEITLGASPTSDGLCRLTSGALKEFKGVIEVADFHWHVFDWLPNEAAWDRSYLARYASLQDLLYSFENTTIMQRVHLVPFEVVNNLDEANEKVAAALNQGYEGGIFRNPREPAKPGRPGKKEQQYVRVKPWVTSEILVTRVVQGNKNTNAAKKNTLGRTERSSAKAGQVPNGEVGSVIGTFIADVYHPFIPGKKLFSAGDIAEVGAGEMTQKEAKHYWENQNEIVGHISTIKHLAHDVHEKVRMGTWVCIRLPQDMSS